MKCLEKDCNSDAVIKIHGKVFCCKCFENYFNRIEVKVGDWNWKLVDDYKGGVKKDY